MNNIKNNIINKTYLELLIQEYLPKNNNKIFISILNYKYYINAFLHKSFFISYAHNDDTDNLCTFLLSNYITLNSVNFNYERLECLGDGIIYSIIVAYLYDKYPDKNEEFMTNIRQKLVKKSQLSYLAKKLNFNKYILLSSQLDCNYSRINNDSLLENVFESFIGALYKDQGYNISRDFFINVIEKYVDFDKLINTDTNYKTKLLLLFHSKKWSNPVYDSIHTSGEFSKRVIYSCIKLKKELVTDNKFRYHFNKLSNKTIEYTKNKLDNNTYSFDSENYYYLFISFNSIKKEAEQIASKNCLLYLDKL